LSNAGWTTNSFPIDVVGAAPGIFTIDASGSGAVLFAGTGLLAQARAGGRAARRGEVIEIYCTGLPRMAQATAVFVGTESAEVLYSGQAPGAVEGLQQVNARIPAGVSAGASVPLRIRIGAAESNMVTIAVSD